MSMSTTIKAPEIRATDTTMVACEDCAGKVRKWAHGQPVHLQAYDRDSGHACCLCGTEGGEVGFYSMNQLGLWAFDRDILDYYRAILHRLRTLERKHYRFHGPDIRNSKGTLEAESKPWAEQVWAYGGVETSHHKTVAVWLYSQPSAKPGQEFTYSAWHNSRTVPVDYVMFLDLDSGQTTEPNTKSNAQEAER